MTPDKRLTMLSLRPNDPLIQSILPSVMCLRRDLHQHPELAFQERRTSDVVAARLEQLGYAVSRGLARTGVVGSLKKGSSERSLGLRADMDALPIAETTSLAYRSTTEGVMHACGHDGHTAMLLGAAELLATHVPFDGTLHLIFQPAEENEGGAQVMCDEGLFDAHPCDAVFGLHNWPGLLLGHLAVRPGPMMAAFATFDIMITGKGGHAAMPHQARDAIGAVPDLVGGLNRLVARTISPIQTAVASVTRINGGSNENVLPDQVIVGGTTRWFDDDVGSSLEAGFHRLCEGLGRLHHVTFDVCYQRRYPVTRNDAAMTDAAKIAASQVLGDDRIQEPVTGSMASEDFAFMLDRLPGAYAWLGVDEPSKTTAPLHGSSFDFNDNALPFGVAYWLALVERELAIGI